MKDIQYNKTAHDFEVRKCIEKLVLEPTQKTILLQKPIPDFIIIDFKTREVTAMELCTEDANETMKYKYYWDGFYKKNGYTNLNILRLEDLNWVSTCRTIATVRIYKPFTEYIKSNKLQFSDTINTALKRLLKEPLRVTAEEQKWLHKVLYNKRSRTIRINQNLLHYITMNCLRLSDTINIALRRLLEE